LTFIPIRRVVPRTVLTSSTAAAVRVDLRAVVTSASWGIDGSNPLAIVCSIFQASSLGVVQTRSNQTSVVVDVAARISRTVSKIVVVAQFRNANIRICCRGPNASGTVIQARVLIGVWCAEIDFANAGNGVPLAVRVTCARGLTEVQGTAGLGETSVEARVPDAPIVDAGAVVALGHAGA
jgi:hypothetical protein